MMHADVRANNRRRRCHGFTLIELLVSISIISVLLALALPAVQSSRESARALRCKSQMRQLGQALHNFESSYQTLPAGNDFSGEERHSWCTRILPFVEQAELYNRYNWSKTWNDSTGLTGQTNNDVTQASLAIYQCPSEPLSRIGGIDYGGNIGTSQTGLPVGYSVGDGWEAGSLLVVNAMTPNPQLNPATFGEFFDGLSQTFLVYECSGRTSEAGHWGSGTNSMAIESSVNSNTDGETIISRHPGGGHVLVADGRVAFVSNNADLTLLCRMATRHGGEVSESAF